jgi:recombination DNA repair RAD52 pathway protein
MWRDIVVARSGLNVYTDSFLRDLDLVEASKRYAYPPRYLRPLIGSKLTYAEGWKIINLANEVFGFNGWSSSVLSITTDYVSLPFDVPTLPILTL